MSIVKQTQWAVEEYLGVDIEVITVMQELHEEITGRYETAHGLTNGHIIGSGMGEGCANGGVRAKLGAIAPMQNAVNQLCEEDSKCERDQAAAYHKYTLQMTERY
jgi:hypothetical protein